MGHNNTHLGKRNSRDKTVESEYLLKCFFVILGMMIHMGPSLLFSKPSQKITYKLYTYLV